MELEILGPAAALYFDAEYGLHKLRDREGEWHSYVLHPVAVAWRVYSDHRPTELHRKSFFDGKQPRRTMTTEGVIDKSAGIAGVGPDLEAILRPILQGLLEGKVHAALT
jgi:hypothetical protein